ncbi:glycosyltransferase family 4 protein [Candidatus Nanosalina sp. VS9-1]|uniref:glycosyltransferase family 4 protein n=1 Tax=Candidatus Nanosalina sp. VS9-1 TaxID=3388566 RepID=UPI0039E1B1CB
MNILLVNDHYSFGGAENYVRGLEEELEEDHEVKTLTLDDSDESDYSIEEASNPVLKLKNRYFYNRRIKREVQQVVEEVDPDVVHLNKNVVAPVAVLKGLRGEKVVKTVHDFGFVSLKDKYAYEMNQFERKIRKTLDRGTQRYLKKLRENVINRYTAPSRALTQELEENGYTPSTHLPNFVTDREPDYEGEHFLFVGRLEDGKAPDLLVEAYRKASGDDYDIPPLEIAGKGKMKEELEEKSSGMGKVTVHGYVSEEKLEGLYRNSKAVVIPSRWRENNPLVALEAKAFGSALIVSDRGGLPELVEEGETGFIFKSEDVEGLIRNLSTEVDWKVLGENSRDDYEQNYRPKVHLEKLLELYNN